MTNTVHHSGRTMPMVKQFLPDLDGENASSALVLDEEFDEEIDSLHFLTLPPGLNEIM